MVRGYLLLGKSGRRERKRVGEREEQGVYDFGLLSAFLDLASSFSMLSTVGSSSGMVPPSSLMVWRTLAPTSRWALLALSLPVIVHSSKDHRWALCFSLTARMMVVWGSKVFSGWRDCTAR